MLFKKQKKVQNIDSQNKALKHRKLSQFKSNKKNKYKYMVQKLNPVVLSLPNLLFAVTPYNQGGYGKHPWFGIKFAFMISEIKRKYEIKILY